MTASNRAPAARHEPSMLQQLWSGIRCGCSATAILLRVPKQPPGVRFLRSLVPSQEKYRPLLFPTVRRSIARDECCPAQPRVTESSCHNRSWFRITPSGAACQCDRSSSRTAAWMCGGRDGRSVAHMWSQLTHVSSITIRLRRVACCQRAGTSDSQSARAIGVRHGGA